MKKIYIAIIGLLILFSCGEDFLAQLPKDQLVTETVFTSYENILTYSWGFYDVLPKMKVFSYSQILVYYCTHINVQFSLNPNPTFF